MTRRVDTKNPMAKHDDRSAIAYSMPWQYTEKEIQSTASEEELKRRYPDIADAPRKKSRRELEACQRREGESDEAFQKRLCAAEKKRSSRAAHKSQSRETLTAGSSKQSQRRQQKNSKPATDQPAIAETPPPTPPPAPEQSPPPLPPPVPDSPGHCEIGIQTGDVDWTLRRTTDFRVDALGVFRAAPVVPWFRQRKKDDNSSPVATVTLPYVPEGSINLLEDQAREVEMLSINYPILEDTNSHIVFIRAPFPDNAQLIDTILDHLAHNRGVKLEGFREPDIIKVLSSEYMATHWNVQPARLVEVHDMFKKMKTPGTPYKKMLHSEFIARLADPTRSEKVLDVPMAH
ncbi:hypothetical protein EV421DRAFT_1917377 [Armillaria borealis]|uniref:Uncharacterized protein n=1 Tax=Armillaria borealis TaxID=47425 RepID=A0AA39M4N3_9AGAR|nr:hypothetical protein EV421DRAFT_1917377 [Armillaria borealis]